MKTEALNTYEKTLLIIGGLIALIMIFINL